MPAATGLPDASRLPLPARMQVRGWRMHSANSHACVNPQAPHAWGVNSFGQHAARRRGGRTEGTGERRGEGGGGGHTCGSGGFVGVSRGGRGIEVRGPRRRRCIVRGDALLLAGPLPRSHGAGRRFGVAGCEGIGEGAVERLAVEGCDAHEALLRHGEGAGEGGAEVPGRGKLHGRDGVAAWACVLTQAEDSLGWLLVCRQ